MLRFLLINSDFGGLVFVCFFSSNLILTPRRTIGSALVGCGEPSAFGSGDVERLGELAPCIFEDNLLNKELKPAPLPALGADIADPDEPPTTFAGSKVSGVEVLGLCCSGMES